MKSLNQGNVWLSPDKIKNESKNTAVITSFENYVQFKNDQRSFLTQSPLNLTVGGETSSPTVGIFHET